MLTAAATGAIGRGGWALITVIIPPLRSSLYLALIIALNGRENKPLSGKRPGQTAAEATTRSPMSGALDVRDPQRKQGPGTMGYMQNLRMRVMSISDVAAVTALNNTAYPAVTTLTEEETASLFE